ncbi:set domain-containing protein [Malassezia pachydermatis]|uniref:Histone-lysine N-methyltransferase, H3 lysine-36 specific n=1 Tax=Malassezia pachydermatis TaxID=77020 RepID=A0A0M8MZB8_9BASI|nr:set domain-containing protein [Malassezia pachydermatis]KOS16561.1 set domain-containing protein [Malassezia pachydermatis]
MSTRKSESDHASGLSDDEVSVASASPSRPSETSGSTSPAKRSGRAAPPPPKLILDLPKAEEQALATFAEIPDCEYQTSRIGRTRGQDDPSCECSLDHGAAFACTDESGCINRLTQVECLPDACRCGKECANQRFQQHAYAKVDIVQTEKKGFGLRAMAPLARDDFVYEYIGEVIHHDTFMRRMVQYKEEHIEHFYFMMLQRDEYIDATKRGSRSRFINHSCNPNCYVSKWHVGRHVRMGIFAKRPILAGEELTFNYNVDRYGNDPQPCYCGEPNCVGTLGGRTQTDIVTMDDRFIAALGIADQVAALRASLPRGKRSKILDEDFHPVLHALDVDDCARVMTAIRDATTNRKMVNMLLTRVQLTEDVHVQKILVKMHGFVVMAGILDEWADDQELVSLCLQCLEKWPLLARDKVMDAGVWEQVRKVAEQDGANQSHAHRLMTQWDALPATFRIARRDGVETNADDSTTLAMLRRAVAATALQAGETPSAEDTESLRRALLAYRAQEDTASSQPTMRRTESKKSEAKEVPKPKPTQSIEDIIRRANEENEARQRALEEAAAAAAAASAAADARTSSARPSKKHKTSSASHDRPEKRAKSDEVDMAALEHRLAKLVGALVVKQMSKVKDQLDRDRFKRYAKDLTQVLCDKEKRHPKTWPPRLPDGQIGLEELSEEKRKKMKLFAHEYIKKLLRHRSTEY